MVWINLFFNKNNTWHFTAMKRHIYIDPVGTLAWFDKLLITQMKICRGSVALLKDGNGWKLMQYILSITVPNGVSDSVEKIKAPPKDKLIEKLSKK